MTTPTEALEHHASQAGLDILDLEFAKYLDSKDDLSHFRSKFYYPKNGSLRKTDPALVDAENDCIYLATHSMGLQPKASTTSINQLLKDWGTRAFEIYNDADLPAQTCDTFGRAEIGRLVGADDSSVILMNGLTVNMGLLLLSFYQPTNERYKILIEENAFPSDRYCAKSIIEMRGHNAEEALLKFCLKPDRLTFDTEDILQKIEREGDSVAVVIIPGIQFSTGQKFEIDKITKKAHEFGCLVGVDVGHAICNVSLQLDNWDVDFAYWCANKYISGGPGGIGGAYVNKKHNNREFPHLKGWYANKEATRFQLREECDEAPGVDVFRMSTPSVFLVSFILSSLQIFDDATMPKIVDKQFLLTGYLEFLLVKFLPIKTRVKIITPSDHTQRGTHLSIKINNPDLVLKELQKRGVVVDLTLGKLMRICPAPLVTKYSDVFAFVQILKTILDEIA